MVQPTGARIGLQTLAIDIGGTGLKADVLDENGNVMVKPVRVPTPYPLSPDVLLNTLAELVEPLPSYDRVSVGFPGVVRDGSVITAPHFGTEIWRGYGLEAAVAHRFGKPARLLNDAEVQGLGIVAGCGLEVVLTLGTGVGSAVFRDGRLTPHIELAHHPIHKDKTYNEYLGNAERRSVGTKKWNRRVERMIAIVKSLLNYDVLYLGGGNAANVTIALADNVKLASNNAGLTGGIRLWDDIVWQAVHSTEAATPSGGPVDPTLVLRAAR